MTVLQNDLDKYATETVSGYWGITLLPETKNGNNDTVYRAATNGSTDPLQLPMPPVTPTVLPTADQAVTNTKAGDIIAAVGSVAAQVIDGMKSGPTTATPPFNGAANTPIPTTDNGKKTATILWIVGGVVLVATLLYLAFKPIK